MKIVVDASALLAILFAEPDAEIYLSKLLMAEKIWISPLNWWEVQVRMLSKYGESGSSHSDSWMQSLKILVEPVTMVQTQFALEAFAKYKGRPSRLNMGDCFAYALAKSKGVGLLFKGNDFAATDVEQA